MCSKYFSDMKAALGLMFAAFRGPGVKVRPLLNTPLKSSTPAFSTSATCQVAVVENAGVENVAPSSTWCHVFHSRVFHSRVFSSPYNFGVSGSILTKLFPRDVPRGRGDKIGILFGRPAP